MKFLVTRMEALHRNGKRGPMHNSDMWPYIVEADSHINAVDRVYLECFGVVHTSKTLPKEFLVVALIDAEVVRLENPPPKPPNYEVRSWPYD